MKIFVNIKEIFYPQVVVVIQQKACSFWDLFKKNIYIKFYFMAFMETCSIGYVELDFIGCIKCWHSIHILIICDKI